MIELFDFQRAAADQIANRFREYASDPAIAGTQKRLVAVPYFQALASVTASGKTVILSDAVSSMCTYAAIPPVVLWLSKGKVVVEQTFENLSPNGKYNHVLGDADFFSLAEFDSIRVKEASVPQVYFATVGTFNQKDQAAGDRLIYRSDIDNAERSTWEALKTRENEDAIRRPLFVVYDEAHNLTDQQTDLLLELEPQAFLLASATMRLPQKLGQQVDLIKQNGRTDDWFTTYVGAKQVADSGLIKSTIVLGGYRSPMEETVSTMLADMVKAEQEAAQEGLEGRPKAIYVCNTNIVEGNAFQKDDARRPFLQREAPPILIWRHLTEQHGIDPSTIAVYCNLTANKDFPLPDDFHLFSGGDKDYREFAAGGYQHIIFNLGLQEGWDDPFCYFAYIDKSMDSRVRIEQIVGRVLRQPSAKHSPSERLNTAHFYIKVDRNDVFNEVLAEVSNKLSQDAPDIRLVRKDPEKSPPEDFEPKGEYVVPMTAHDTTDAVEPIAELLNYLTDYRNDDGTNTKSEGERRVVTQHLGEQEIPTAVWESFGLAGSVSARWLFQRSVSAKYQNALGLAPVSSPKFDASIGFDSKAHKHIESVAGQVVDAFFENVRLVQRPKNPYKVGAILVRRDEMQPFSNAIHEGYDGLNPLELKFARELDRTGLTWCRNPSKNGYGVSLLTIGPTKTFYPGFLVWKDDTVFAIDTTGDHLLREKTGRKLLSITPPKNDDRRVVIQLVSENKYNRNLELEEKGGYTLWDLRQDGSLRARHFHGIDELLKMALR